MTGGSRLEYMLLAVTDAEHGMVVRSLQHLGIDPTVLRDHTHPIDR